MVVLNDKHDRKIPKLGHVVGLVDLTLVRRTITKVGKRYIIIAFVFIRERETSTQWHLRCNDPVATIEMLLFREHVHRAAFAFRKTTLAASQFGHDASWVHATCQHMTVIAIGRHAFVTVFGCGLKAHNNGFLTDIKVAETTDQAHAIKLARLFLKPPDQQHFPVMSQQFFG